MHYCTPYNISDANLAYWGNFEDYRTCIASGIGSSREYGLQVRSCHNLLIRRAPILFSYQHGIVPLYDNHDQSRAKIDPLLQRAVADPSYNMEKGFEPFSKNQGFIWDSSRRTIA